MLRDANGNMVSLDEARRQIERARRGLGGKRPKRKDPKPSGYAGTPGKGPDGETCKSCAHYVRREGYAKAYLKCRLIQTGWTNGRKTDILAGSPACEKWEAK